MIVCKMRIRINRIREIQEISPGITDGVNMCHVSNDD